MSKNPPYFQFRTLATRRELVSRRGSGISRNPDIILVHTFLSESFAFICLQFEMYSVSAMYKIDV